MSRAPLSIVIPCLNAMPRLADCLSALVEGLADGLIREAIVVDGSSDDQSAELATDMGAKVIVIDQESRGRGHQLMIGANAAEGDWLLFIHADTVLEAGWPEKVWDFISANPTNKAGFFRLAFDGDSSGSKRVADLANWRAQHLGLPYGDAGLLISRTLYNAIGGYRGMPLMEDVDLVHRLGKRRLVGLDVTATTSAVKYMRGGWWAVPARNLFLLCAYRLGVKPETLAKWYK